MHVLFDARLLHRPLSGLERVQRNLLRELGRHQRVDRLRVVLRHGTELPATFPQRAEPVFVHGTEDILRELLQPETRPDVYHLSWFPDRNPRDLWLPLAAKASVVEVHDAILNRHPEYHPNHECWKWYHAFVRALVHGADRLLCHSRSVIEEVVRDLGGERARCDLAPLAVEPTLRTPLAADDARARRQRLGVPDRYLLAVGKDYPHKGHATLFRAIARLGQQVPVVCAGSQVWHGTGSTRELLAGLGMTEQVQWLEGLGDDDVKALLQGATALVYPSSEEGFGLPPIEAMALGTPVLAAAAMSIPEVCGDGAWLFPPDDVGALAALLQRVQHEPAQVAELVARGRAREATYSWQRCADATVECYGRAIGKAGKGSVGKGRAGKRRRAALPPDVLGALLVQAQSPFRVERELAAWQERCLSVENTLRETLERLRALEPDQAPPPAPPVLPAAGPPPPAAAPRFSLTRRMRKIRDRLLGRGTPT